MTLTNAPVGISLVIREVAGEIKMNKQLCDLGLMAGLEVEIIHTLDSGPLVLRIGGDKLALGRSVASKILVDYRN